jgi:hypothetical protein
VEKAGLGGQQRTMGGAEKRGGEGSGWGGASHQGRRPGQGRRGVREGRRIRRSHQCWCRCRSGKGPPRCTRPHLQDRVSEHPKPRPSTALERPNPPALCPALPCKPRP